MNKENLKTNLYNSALELFKLYPDYWTIEFADEDNLKQLAASYGWADGFYENGLSTEECETLKQLAASYGWADGFYENGLSTEECETQVIAAWEWHKTNNLLPEVQAD